MAEFKPVAVSSCGSETKGSTNIQNEVQISFVHIGSDLIIGRCYIAHVNGTQFFSTKNASDAYSCFYTNIEGKRAQDVFKSPFGNKSDFKWNWDYFCSLNNSNLELNL